MVSGEETFPSSLTFNLRPSTFNASSTLNLQRIFDLRPSTFNASLTLNPQPSTLQASFDMSSSSSNDGSGSEQPRDPSRPSGKGVRPFFSSSWIIVAVAFSLIAMTLMNWSARSASRVDYMFLWKQIEATNVERVEFDDQIVRGKWKVTPPKPDPKSADLKSDFIVDLPVPFDHELKNHLRNHGVQFTGKSQAGIFGMSEFVVLLNVLSFVAFVWFMWFILRRNSDPMGSGMMSSFIRSPAKRFKPSDQQTPSMTSPRWRTPSLSCRRSSSSSRLRPSSCGWVLRFRRECC